MSSFAIIYHYPCLDGVLGALAARLHCAHVSPTAAITFHPLATWAKEEERAALVSSLRGSGTVAYVIDISGSLDFIMALCGVCERVVLLDHHKAAFEVQEGLDASAGGRPANFEACTVLDHSGCVIAWNYFKLGGSCAAALGGDPAVGERLQQCFALAEDQDLFTFLLPQTKGFAAAVGEAKIEYNAAKNPGLWEALLSLDPAALSASGAQLLQKQADIRAGEREGAFVVKVFPEGSPAQVALECLAIVSKHPDLRSEAGNELAQLSKARGLAPAGVVAYFEPGAGAGTIKVSIRSLPELDVAEVCKLHGGGGHKVRVTPCYPLFITPQHWPHKSELTHTHPTRTRPRILFIYLYRMLHPALYQRPRLPPGDSNNTHSKLIIAI
jgi:hypothetical protein